MRPNKRLVSNANALATSWGAKKCVKDPAAARSVVCGVRSRPPGRIGDLRRAAAAFAPRGVDGARHSRNLRDGVLAEPFRRFVAQRRRPQGGELCLEAMNEKGSVPTVRATPCKPNSEPRPFPPMIGERSLCGLNGGRRRPIASHRARRRPAQCASASLTTSQWKSFAPLSRGSLHKSEEGA